MVIGSHDLGPGLLQYNHPDAFAFPGLIEQVLSVTVHRDVVVHNYLYFLLYVAGQAEVHYIEALLRDLEIWEYFLNQFGVRHQFHQRLC